MATDWNHLPENTQLALTQAALAQAAATIAGQAESLAQEMEGGALDDRGGPEALRLLAAVVRALSPLSGPVAGHA